MVRGASNGQNTALSERARRIVRAQGFHADHADAAAQAAGSDGDPAELTPAAHGAEDGIQIGNILHEFDRRGCLTRHDGKVVVRVDECRAGSLHQRARAVDSRAASVGSHSSTISPP